MLEAEWTKDAAEVRAREWPCRKRRRVRLQLAHKDDGRQQSSLPLERDRHDQARVGSLLHQSGRASLR